MNPIHINFSSPGYPNKFLYEILSPSVYDSFQNFDINVQNALLLISLNVFDMSKGCSKACTIIYCCWHCNIGITRTFLY